ncbi:hypothetical protein FKM82_022806 [Ascaphus truei]
MGWNACRGNKTVIRDELPLCLEKNVFGQCILPVLTYGWKTWNLSVKITQKLQTMQRSMERCMLGVTRRDGNKNEWLCNPTSVCDILTWGGEEMKMAVGRTHCKKK